MKRLSQALLCLSALAGIFLSAHAQTREDDVLIAHRKAIETELESIAVIERKVMVPMCDGKRMQADIYRPKDSSKKYPILFVRTPYNFNDWDVALGAPNDMSTALDAVKHGYAYVEMNERGRFFSEGDYDILGTPLTDSDDELDWLGGLPWSADKVGLIGCSSTAEWQLSVASRGNKALTTFVPQSFGDGVGRVGPYYEQGNWFRGAPCRCVLRAGFTAMDLPPPMAAPTFLRACRSSNSYPRPGPTIWQQSPRP